MPKINHNYNYKKSKKNSSLIIFIHGAGCDQTFWSLLNRYYYFKGFSTLAINFPGHGDHGGKGLSSIDEMAKFVQNIVKKYSTKENILIGHSMGSLVCLSILVSKLFSIKKAVLIGVAFPMKVSSFLLNISKKNSREAIEKMIHWSFSSESKLRGNHLIGFNLPNFVNVLMNKTSEKNLYRDLNACDKYLVELEKIKKIDTPCLIIAGSRDIMTPAKNGYILSRSMKNSSIEIIDNCGHFHIHEKSNEVRTLVSSYIENKI